MAPLAAAAAGVRAAAEGGSLLLGQRLRSARRGALQPPPPPPAAAAAAAAQAELAGCGVGGSAGSCALGRLRPRGQQILCLAHAAGVAAALRGRGGCSARRRRGGEGRRFSLTARRALEEDDPFSDEHYSGPAVEISNATVRRGPNMILEECELKVPRGARAVVVGANGCGKTTLLSVIAGREAVEGGYMSVNAPTVGWLRQEAVGGSKRTVLEEAMAEMPAKGLEAALKAAEEKLNGADGESSQALKEAQEEYDEAARRFEAIGGYSMNKRAEEVLTGLGFVAQDWGRACSELSGGWQMRVALARALLREPALLLLDEPTNHMDSAAKRWLASHLAGGLSPDVTMLLVTHDRSLLEDIRCTHVLEIAEKRIVPYPVSSILQWERSRAERVKSLQREMGKVEKELREDREYVAKWGAKTSHAKMAQQRLKKIAKAEKDLAELQAATRGLPSVAAALGKVVGDAESAADGTLPLSGPSRVSLKLPDPPLMMEPPIDGVLLGLREVDVGYEGTSPIIGGVGMELKPMSRVALLGPNGVGKTTLLRTLAGTMKNSTGKRRVGVGGLRKARIGLFTQDLAQDLPGDTTPVDYVLKDAPLMLDEQGARQALGALGLRGEVHKSKISSLSGGEKARVALAVFATRPSDILLLDEPTNHLDGAAVTALSEGLRRHTENGGAVLVASHDKAFVEALQVTHTAVVSRGEAGQPGSMCVELGPPPALHTTNNPSPFAAEAAGGANPVEIVEEVVDERILARKERQEDREKGREARRDARKAHKKAEKLLASIEKQEEELEVAQAEVNEAWSQEKFDACEKLRLELEGAYAEWEELVELSQAA